MARAPLAGVRVLDLSRLLPGPYATLVLSDLGASVDKVEDPGAGDYLRDFHAGWPSSTSRRSGKFDAINRDKRSLVLDLKSDAGRAAFLRLIPRYDVMLESFRPGVLERLRLGWDVLHATHPRLVLCSISGYSPTGPYRERAAHDLNTAALAGLIGLAGPHDATPAVPSTQLADLSSGLFAATGILAALFAAQRDGVGSRVDVSMADSVFALAIPTLGDLSVEALPPRGRDLLTGGAACYGIYRTADDRFLSVAALEPKFWLLFCATIGRVGSVAEVAAPLAEQERIVAEVQQILATKTRDEWTQIFSTVDACVEPVLAPHEVPTHAVFAHAFVDVDGQKLPRTPFVRDAHTRAPTQGEHTAVILREAGFSDAEIAALQGASKS